MVMYPDDRPSVAILHGAGYTGGELIRLLLRHPHLRLECVTSRSFAGQPLWAAHPDLRGQTELHFSEECDGADALLLAAEHGQAARMVPGLIDGGHEGPIVDLSADFRFSSPAIYPHWFGFDHPAPELLKDFQYGLPEVYAPYASNVRLVANPGCFATALTLALHPLAAHQLLLSASVTALTGASGSGATPRATTHFPTREGNVRAYKALAHQHLPEVLSTLGDVDIHFVPVSGPWVRGIWGTAHVELSDEVGPDQIKDWYESAYGESPAVRLWPDQLPEMRSSVNTPFCDIGWVQKGDHLVVGFALDNLLKGAASQAVQNLNLVMGLPEMAGLLPIGSDGKDGKAGRERREEEKADAR
jgi:LysW-gamma-L-alpha-aminoadipyl-6-phosphate/LysW-L-glutamyl-5-phosphate reductase